MYSCIVGDISVVTYRWKIEPAGQGKIGEAPNWSKHELSGQGKTGEAPNWSKHELSVGVGRYCQQGQV